MGPTCRQPNQSAGIASQAVLDICTQAVINSGLELRLRPHRGAATEDVEPSPFTFHKLHEPSSPFQSPSGYKPLNPAPLSIAHLWGGFISKNSLKN